MKTNTPTHAGAVFRLLHDLWPKNGYAILGEVGNSTGSRTRRHADAVVMSLWPSRGLDVYGVEIKVSRSDWLSELANPEKADEIARYCDGWYVAVARREIVGDTELPKTWGLIACDGGKAKIVKAAPTLTPKPLDRGFVAAMLRRAAEFHVPEKWLEEERNRIYENAAESVRRLCDNETGREKARAEKAEAAIAAFETATGVKIDGWRPDATAATFRRLKKALDDGDQELEYLAERFERAAVGIREVVADLRTSRVLIKHAEDRR